MRRQQVAQGRDVLTVNVLHREAKPVRLHVLEIGVELQPAGLIDVDNQGEGLIVLGVPDVGLVGGTPASDRSIRRCCQTLPPW